MVGAGPRATARRLGLVVALVAGLAGVVSPAAAVVPGAIISGHLTVPAGVALADQWIGAIDVFADQDDLAAYHRATVQPDGSYVIDSLPAATYLVRAFGTSAVRYGYHPDETSLVDATRLLLGGPSSVVTGIDIDLDTGGVLTGTVDAGHERSMIDVVVTDAASGGLLKWTSTDAVGAYRINALPSGVPLLVEFRTRGGSGYVDEFFDGVYDEQEATPITLTPGGTAAADATMATKGGILGRVLTPTGVPMADIEVAAISWDLGVIEHALTDSLGNYWLQELPPGAYTIQFRSSASDPRYATQWFDGAGTEDAAEEVWVDADEVVELPDVRMSRSAELTVTGLPDGVDTQFATLVDLQPTQSLHPQGAVTFQRLMPGSTRVAFARATGDTPYVRQYYRASGGTTTDLNLASWVDLPEGRTTITPGPLMTGGSVAGTVTDAAGAPAPGRLVVAFVDDGVHATRSATTDAAGHYTIRGLSPGSYQVAVPESNATGGDTFHASGVQPPSPNVAVGAGSTTSGIDVRVGTRFVDVQPSAAFAADIEWLGAQGITRPGPEARFNPLGSVTREAMAAFLYRAAGSPAFTAPATSPFPDVQPGDPFYLELAWLSAAGITRPGADGEFRPKEPVTREAMAAFLYRAAGSPAFTTPTTSPFADVQPGDPFYREMAWLSSVRITRPGADGKFRPKDSVTREAMAAFLHRADDAGLL